ncbi:hypothetical protein Salat_0630500 [Sesamum alatum]|uniref:Reverse transcriptase zinc-binding domain-containing protein n=1 Tax=Sesamum alatum TaxID=300844 RepID=A0AAE1YR77_9LAMI|nr:hypothetical protein Salat_0630500 [Sesamum alatum]
MMEVVSCSDSGNGFAPTDYEDGGYECNRGYARGHSFRGRGRGRVVVVTGAGTNSPQMDVQHDAGGYNQEAPRVGIMFEVSMAETSTAGESNAIAHTGGTGHPACTMRLCTLSVLRPVRGIEVRILLENRFLLQFQHMVDRDIPLRMMTREVAESVGNRLGRFVDFDQGQAWGASFRIRVAMDVRRPLTRFLRVKAPKRELTTSITYGTALQTMFEGGKRGSVYSGRAGVGGGQKTDSGNWRADEEGEQGSQEAAGRCQERAAGRGRGRAGMVETWGDVERRGSEKFGVRELGATIGLSEGLGCSQLGEHYHLSIPISPTTMMGSLQTKLLTLAHQIFSLRLIPLKFSQNPLPEHSHATLYGDSSDEAGQISSPELELSGVRRTNIPTGEVVSAASPPRAGSSQHLVAGARAMGPAPTAYAKLPTTARNCCLCVCLSLPTAGGTAWNCLPAWQPHARTPARAPVVRALGPFFSASHSVCRSVRFLSAVRACFWFPRPALVEFSRPAWVICLPTFTAVVQTCSANLALQPSVPPLPAPWSSFLRTVAAFDKFWRKLWATPIPPRVKLCIWRFCFEAVPTMENLAKRRVDVEPQCIHCTADVESLQHILLECPFTRLTWALSDIPWFQIGTWRKGAATWVLGAAMRLKGDQWARFLMVCWALWRNRNKKRMEGIEQDPRRLV